MPIELPRWVTSNDASVWREVADYRGMTNEERAAILARACETAAAILRVRDDAVRVLEYREPPHPSAIAALERLRARACRHS